MIMTDHSLDQMRDSNCARCRSAEIEIRELREQVSWASGEIGQLKTTIRSLKERLADALKETDDAERSGTENRCG